MASLSKAKPAERLQISEWTKLKFFEELLLKTERRICQELSVGLV